MSNTDGLVSDSSGSDDRFRRDYLGLHRNADEAGAEPGRNILLHGVDARDGHVRPARKAELRRSVSVLEQMTAPAPRGGTVPTTQAGSADPTLAAIAACESGGDPTAVGGGGLYRGKYQFSYETWQSVGGTGDPAAAPEAEQDRRAAMLLARDGAGHWPACGG
jgi:hypothetical protein